MKIAYFDCIGGISGDMTLGALVDVGLPLDSLKNELKKLPFSGYKIAAKKVQKQGIQATKVDVIEARAEGKSRSLREINKLIADSTLGKKIKSQATSIFANLAKAEAEVHGTTPDKVHFHEVGAVDSVIDIVGAVIGLNELSIDAIYCSKLAPAKPAPATLQILTGTPITGSDVPIESVTPTGAAIVKTLASDFGETPPMTIERIGYGAGSADLDTPNVLRVIIGEASDICHLTSDENSERVLLIETNIDDLSGEKLGYIMTSLFDAGALDVWFVPIYMKKNRPAVTLKVLAPIYKDKDLIRKIF